MKIIILTGSEIRHEYFRKYLANDQRLEVLSTYCEGVENGLEARTRANPSATELELQHVLARKQAETDFFALANQLLPDRSNPQFISKGDINSKNVVESIIQQSPDLLICYGSSLIRSKLLSLYYRKFLNVHLGLSPYYRGSATNVWPLIDRAPWMVGATFMHIDEGIDTGEIIHQIQADVFFGDSAHSIGNRLIKKMANTYIQIIVNFNKLVVMPQPQEKGRLYQQKEFNEEACRLLYKNFREGIIEDYLSKKRKNVGVVENEALK